MRKPDPARFTPQTKSKRKADKLEMKGFSSPPDDGLPQKEKKTSIPPPSSTKKKTVKARKASGRKKDSPVSRVKTTKKPRSHETTIPRYHDTTVSRYRDTTIEFIRSAVKSLGKEAATHRFTPEEKKAIADLIYAYKNRGIKTSENEIARIAINYIIRDYKDNGANSILDKVLKALNK